MNGTATLERIALAIPEARVEHGLSQRQLAGLSGVGATTIRKLEHGGLIDPALLVRLAATLVVLDAHKPRIFDPDLLLDTEAWEAMTR